VRVLLVNDNAPGPGSGVEVHVQRVADALRAAGDTVEVFAGAVRHAGARKALDVWDPMARRALRRVADRFQPDVVHHHNVIRELSVSVLGVPPGVAQVLTVHDYRLLRAHEGPEAEQRRSPLLAVKAVKGVLDRAVVRRRIDIVVAVSAALEGSLRDAGFPRVRTVANFADPEPPGQALPPGDDVVYAGRLSPEKGLDVLIGAFASVAAAHPTACLRIAGEGPERPELERLAEARAPGRIVFHGMLGAAEVRELMRRARVVCAPSTRVTEGAPLVAIEALLTGRPVLGTESPAFRELLRDGDLGPIVPWGDGAALAAALDLLLADRALAQQIGDRARAVAEEVHTPAAAVAALHEVYAAAMELAA